VHDRVSISNLKSPAQKERGSPSPTFGTKVGLGGKSQNDPEQIASQLDGASISKFKMNKNNFEFYIVILYFEI